MKEKKLRPHQRKAIDELRSGCILNGDVGSGKTLTALAYYVEKVCGGSLDRSSPMTRPRNLLIITTAKKRDKKDWQSEMLHVGLFDDPETCYGGVEIIVDSQQNIKKYKDLSGWFIIYDEQAYVGSGVWAKTFIDLNKRNEWILLSATPADSWMDYIPVFISNGFYRNRTEFINEHVIYKFQGQYRVIRGYYGVRHLNALRNSILVDMPFERHTVRYILPIEVSYDKGLFDRVWLSRWNVYEDCPLLDSGEMHRLGRRVVNEDPDRLDQICELSARHARMIVWYNFNYELESLRTLHTRLDIPVAEWNGHRHEEIPETERWLYLVQYTAGAEGWNCTSTDAMVYHSLTYSHKVFYQTQGRIDRMNTPFDALFYYVLMSKSAIDRKIWRSLQQKKDFHEGPKVKF